MATALQCVVVTPETTVLDESADFVTIPLYDGEMGIARGHSPLIGRLGYGELRIRTGDDVSRYYVDGGFVQVADNVVSVLTSRAVPAADLDADVARQQLESALRQPTSSPELCAIRDRLESQARGQLWVARNP